MAKATQLAKIDSSIKISNGLKRRLLRKARISKSRRKQIVVSEFLKTDEILDDFKQRQFTASLSHTELKCTASMHWLILYFKILVYLSNYVFICSLF